jgi:hypothetical protein
MASIISDWIRGEIGSEPTVPASGAASSRMRSAATGSRLASASAAWRPNLRLAIATFWVTCSVSPAETE